MKSKGWFLFLTLALAGAILFNGLLPALDVARAASDAPAAGGTFTVNTTADSNDGSDGKISLREALLLARGGTGGDGTSTGLGRALTGGEQAQLAGCTISGGLITAGCGAGITDTIAFNLVSVTIAPTLPLPLIADSAPTIVNGVSGLLGVILDTTNVGATHNGLHISSNNNIVENLEVYNSPNDNFFVDGDNNLLYNVVTLSAGLDGIYISGNSNTVDSSYAGVASGGCFGNARDGIQLAAGSQFNTVKYSSIGCNTDFGIAIQTSGVNGNHTIGPNNVIGGLAHANGFTGMFIGTNDNTVLSNTISYNGLNGVEINASFNSLMGNQIVTNTLNGVELFGLAANNYIGCSTPFCLSVGGNHIAANLRYGVEITGTSVAFNIVEGNRIGTSADGTKAQPNALGGVLVFGAHDTTIGDAGARANAISGNNGVGVTLDNGAYNMGLAGNCIGVSCQDFVSALPNLGSGVVLRGGAHDNTIGAGGAGLGNYIEWNGARGIFIDGATTRRTTINNNAVLDNVDVGVYLADGTHDNVIGNDALNHNSISYNKNGGIAIVGMAYSNTVGYANIYNNKAGGVFIGTGAFSNTVSNNLIGANTGDGVSISGVSHGNTISYNNIGTNIADSDFGNDGFGVRISGGAYDNTVGASDPSSFANYIGWNLSGGVSLDNGNSNTLFRNRIVFNGPNGVQIINGSHDNSVGGGSDSTANNIHTNAADGLVIASGAHDNLIGRNQISLSTRHGVILTGTGTISNSLSGTVIFNNGLDGINQGGGAADNVWTHISTNGDGGLGIDVNAGDDSNNFITGPFPIITSVTQNLGNVTVKGKADTMVPLTRIVTVELYRVATDPSGYGEGDTYVGSDQTDINGNWTITFASGSIGCYTAFQTDAIIVIGGMANSSEFGPNSCRTFLPLIQR